MKRIYAFALCFGFFAIQILFGQAREDIIGKWVNESGVTVVEITSEYLYVPENILRWGKLSESGHRIEPEDGNYKLQFSEDGKTASASGGALDFWGGSRINASFSLNKDGSLTFTLENSAYDTIENLGVYENKQIFTLRKER